MKHVPAWTKTLATMLDCVRERPDTEWVRCWCDTCKRVRTLDAATLAALVQKVGPDYSLINRRSRCKLSPGCVGWVSFKFYHGVFRRLNDDRTEERWQEEDAKLRSAMRLIEAEARKREMHIAQFFDCAAIHGRR